MSKTRISYHAIIRYLELVGGLQVRINQIKWSLGSRSTDFTVLEWLINQYGLDVDQVKRFIVPSKFVDAVARLRPKPAANIMISSKFRIIVIDRVVVTVRLTNARKLIPV